jgi:hypothetical protein
MPVAFFRKLLRKVYFTEVVILHILYIFRKKSVHSFQNHEVVKKRNTIDVSEAPFENDTTFSEDRETAGRI